MERQGPENAFFLCPPHISLSFLCFPPRFLFFVTGCLGSRRTVGRGWDQRMVCKIAPLVVRAAGHGSSSAAVVALRAACSRII